MLGKRHWERTIENTDEKLNQQTVERGAIIRSTKGRKWDERYAYFDSNSIMSNTEERYQRYRKQEWKQLVGRLMADYNDLHQAASQIA